MPSRPARTQELPAASPVSLLSVLCDANPADKTEIYTELGLGGLRLTYHPGEGQATGRFEPKSPSALVSIGNSKVSEGGLELPESGGHRHARDAIGSRLSRRFGRRTLPPMA